VEPELRTYHDDRTAGVIHPLAEQVLAEPALLALEHIRERFERALAAAPDRLAAAAVVEERVHRLLQHPLLVAEDDLRRLVLDQLGQPVVAVDYPAVEIVQVAGGEATAVERHQGAQIRRNDRDHIQDHPRGVVRDVPRIARREESIDDLEPLQHLLLAVLAGLFGHRLAELLGQLLDLDPIE
jgi:acyl-CoA reductase-like NAD-dependent aldehyde dehydrogenase